MEHDNDFDPTDEQLAYSEGGTYIYGFNIGGRAYLDGYDLMAFLLETSKELMANDEACDGMVVVVAEILQTVMGASTSTVEFAPDLTEFMDEDALNKYHEHIKSIPNN